MKKSLSVLLVLIIQITFLKAQIIKEKYCIDKNLTTSNNGNWQNTFLTADSGKIIIYGSNHNINSNPYIDDLSKDILITKFSKDDRIEWQKFFGTTWYDVFDKLVYSKNKDAYYMSFVSVEKPSSSSCSQCTDSLKKVISKISLDGTLIWQNESFVPIQRKYTVNYSGSNISGLFGRFDLHVTNNDDVIVFDTKTDSTKKVLGIYSIKLSGSNGSPLINKFLPVNFPSFKYINSLHEPIFESNYFTSVNYNNYNNFILGIELTNSEVPTGTRPYYHNDIFIFNSQLDTIGYKSIATSSSNFEAHKFNNIIELPNGNIFTSFSESQAAQSPNTSYKDRLFLDANLNIIKFHTTANANEEYVHHYYIVDTTLITLSDNHLRLLFPNTRISILRQYDFNGNLLIEKKIHTFDGDAHPDGINYFSSVVNLINNRFIYTHQTGGFSGTTIKTDSLFIIDLNGNSILKTKLDTIKTYDGVTYDKLIIKPTSSMFNNLDENSATNTFDISVYSGTSAPVTNTNLFGSLKYNSSGSVVYTKYAEMEKIPDITGNTNFPKYFNLKPNETVCFLLDQSNSVCSDARNAQLYYANTNSNKILGKTYIDINNNNTYNAGTDILFTQGSAKSTKSSNNTISYLNEFGQYINTVDTGTYNTIFTGYNNYFNVLPASKTTSHNTYGYIDTADFALKPMGNINDLRVTLVNTWVTRPGFTNSYEAVYVNEGTTVINNASVAVVLDNRLTYNNSVPSPSAIIGDTLKWNLATLNPSLQGKIKINFTGKTPPTLNGSDIVISKAIIYPISNDTTPSDNQYALSDSVRNAFDPNDKNIESNALLTPVQITSGDYITYRVRFQNTGNFSATNVIIKDTLDNNLDWNSLQIIASSHTGLQTSVLSNNIIEFRFNNINLPASSVNQTTSHGYIVFKIKPKYTLVAGNTIKNTAHITFDFNVPIKTNIAIAKVVTITATINKNNTIGELNLFPNPNNGNFTVDFSSKGNYPITISLFDVTGKIVYQENLQHNNRSFIQISDAVLPSGLYNLQICSSNDIWNKKVLITK